MEKVENFESEAAGEELITTQTELMQKNVGRALVEKAVQGDEAAFEELYKLTYRYVYAVAKYYLSDDEDIRDAIQDTFTRVYKNISKLNDHEAFAWWLRKIAENCSKTVFSKKEKMDRELTDLEDKIISHEDPLKSSDVSLDITEVLEAMSPAEAELLTRIYYDKMTVTEIVRLQGLPHSTVRSRVKAAEKHLRELLRVRGIDKPFYGGEFVAMITTAFRNAIGTDLLSATVAQEILNNVRGGDEKRGAVITAVAKKERNKAVLRLAAIMVAVAIFFALLLFGAYAIINRISVSDGGQQTAENSQPDMSFWDKLFGNDDTSSDDSYASDTSHTSSEEVGSTESPSSNGGSSSGSEGFISSDSLSSNTPASSGASSDSSSQIQTPSVENTVFVPDCTPAEYNIYGNMPHNTTYHYGRVARQGDWLYYISDGGVYKVKTDGTEKQNICKTSSNAMGLNVVGEWIYYIDAYEYDGTGNIVKVRTDGKKGQVLVSESARTLQIIGDKGYYVTKVKDSLTGITKYAYKSVDLNTKETTEIPIDVEYTATITEDYFIYADTNHDILVYDRKTNKQIACLDDIKSCNFLVYKDVLIVNYGGLTDYYYVYDLSNLEKGFISLPDTKQFVEHVYFYSPYDGGMVGATETVYRLEDQTGVKWPFAWETKSKRVYATFDDEYVYIVNGGNLYCSYPDGTDFKQIA